MNALSFDKQFFINQKKEQNRKVFVTPELATLWLEKRNKQNRNPSNTSAEMYSKEILAGKWSATNQGIGFDWDGQITDGQTRLLAIKLAGVGIHVWILTGQDPVSRLRVDGGRNRTSSHYLQMFADFQAPDTAAKALWAIRRFGLQHRERLTGEQTVELGKRYRRSLEWVCENAGTGPWRRAPIVGALAFAYATNPTAVADANEALKSGIGLTARDAILVFRNMVIRSVGKSSDQANQEMFNRLLSAIYHRINGTTVTQLKLSEEAVRHFKNGKSGSKSQMQIIPSLIATTWKVNKKNTTGSNGHSTEQE